MKKLRNLGRTLSKQEQKRIIGGDYGAFACSASADCYSKVWNSTTQQYDKTKTGSVSCSGVGDCVITSTGVSCPQSSGDPKTGTCPYGSFTN